ncbi:PilZ domain-containing protein [Thiomicrorhabdus marina]|nr:PilZ domain-containing protein [Thiomicrorhabdus marina]
MGQRSYFRIDVMMRCSYRVVPAAEVESNPLSEDTSSGYIEKYMMQDLIELDKHINDAIVQINERSSLLANAINSINTKLNFLMETLDSSQMLKAIPQRPVNLSGNGIAFDIDQEIDIDDKVDLLMQPLDNQSPILVRASVVNIQPKEFGAINRIALTYDALKEEDRRKLIYFIQSKEIELAQSSKVDRHTKKEVNRD